MTNGSLMKVESIAEFCNAFNLHLAIIGHENQFLVFFKVAVLHRFYCAIMNCFFASGDFCRLLITFVNSLDPDKTDTLIVFLKEFLKKVKFEKVCRRQQKHEKIIQRAKILVSLYDINNVN